MEHILLNYFTTICPWILHTNVSRYVGYGMINLIIKYKQDIWYESRWKYYHTWL